MNNNFKRNAQGGFTLIELIVVIVILGILAATALPKFINLGADARAASLQGARGAMNSASALVHGKWMVSGGTSAIKQVAIDGGTNIAVGDNGFPTGQGIVDATGLSSSDYVILPNTPFERGNAAVITVAPKGLTAATASACTITYTVATGVAAVADALNCN